MQPAVLLFAAGMVGFGVVGLSTGYFAGEWQPVVPWLAGRMVLGYASAALLLVCGLALLSERAARWSVRVLCLYLAVWQLLRLPGVVRQPGVEVVWENMAETAAYLAGGLVLLVLLGGLRGWLAGERGLRVARFWLGVWLIPVGLSHFFYAKVTYSMVPAWMPWRVVWGPFTGAGHIAAGLGLLAGLRFRALGRVAAWCEAAMIALFTLLIWIPAAAMRPQVVGNWDELCTSWLFGAAACLVAQSFANPGETLPG